MFWSEETCRNSCIQLFFQVTTHTLCMWSFDLSFSYGFQEYEWNPSDITWHTELRNVRLKVCKWADETLSVLMKALLQLFVIYTHEALAAVGIYASVMLTHTGLLRKKKKKKKQKLRAHTRGGPALWSGKYDSDTVLHCGLCSVLGPVRDC